MRRMSGGYMEISGWKKVRREAEDEELLKCYRCGDSVMTDEVVSSGEETEGR
jgi:hypothetical protein